MGDSTQTSGKTYVCKTCDLQFAILEDETPVCCPLCRMNRIDAGG